MLRNLLWFLDVVWFCWNFSLNFFEFWLFPGNQSYCVLLAYIFQTSLLFFLIFCHLRFGHLRLTVMRVFGLSLPKAAMNLPNFWYGSFSYGPLWENYTLYAGKILIWRNFGHLRPKFVHFLAKIDSFESFWPITSKRCYESSIFFGMEVVLMVLFEKIILYMPGKFWYGVILAI